MNPNPDPTPNTRPSAGASWDDLPGYGVSPLSPATPTTPAMTASFRDRKTSPVLAVASIAALGVAVWVLLGTPALSSTVVLAAAIALVILLGLVLVLRR